MELRSGCAPNIGHDECGGTGSITVASLDDAGAQCLRLMAHALFAVPKCLAQGGEVRAAEVAQFDPLVIVPQPFDGIELGRVGRQLLEMQLLPPRRALPSSSRYETTPMFHQFYVTCCPAKPLHPSRSRYDKG
jgi:hypothetical protein